MAEAHALCQTHPDVVSDLEWQGELDAEIDHMLLPRRIETANSTAVMETAADLRAALESSSTSMRRLGANADHRVCLRAEFAADDAEVITGIHRTCILRGGQYAPAPYMAEMTLHLVAGRWRSASIRAGLRNAPCNVIGPNRP